MLLPLNSESAQIHINPNAPRKTKIAYNFGLSGCNRVKVYGLGTVYVATTLAIQSNIGVTFHPLQWHC